VNRIDCQKCKHWWGDQLECKHGYRWASNAGGAAADCKEHVCRCRDYEENIEDDEDDN